jgi:hypothetical protein
MGAMEAIGALHEDFNHFGNDITGSNDHEYHHMGKFLDHWDAARDQLKTGANGLFPLTESHRVGDYLNTSLSLSGIYHHLNQAGEHMQTGFPGSGAAGAFQYHLPLILAHVQAYQTALNE